MTGSRLDQLRAVVRDPERKALPTILFETIALSLKARQPAGFYFSSFLYKKGVDVADHLSTRDMWGIQDVLSDPAAVDIVHNKLFIHEFFSGRHIPVPRLLAYNFNERLFAEAGESWRLHLIGGLDNCVAALRSLVAKSNSKSIFVKPTKGWGGSRTRKVSDTDLREQGPAIHDYMLSSSYIIQEEVAQHPALKTLNPTSLNTVRMDTFRAKGRTAQIMSALLRMGMAGSSADNIAAGGVYTGIDLETGRLNERAYKKLAKSAVGYLAHPTSGVTFKGYQLPTFEDVKRIALDAANLLPPALVGWDIAVSESGPLLIEGNSRYYDMQLSDVAYGGYIKNPVFQQALKLARGMKSR